jgi:hypothetical protein
VPAGLANEDSDRVGARLRHQDDATVEWLGPRVFGYTLALVLAVVTASVVVLVT